MENELCLKNGNKKPIYDISENDTKVIFKTQVDDVTVIEIDEETAKKLNSRQKIFIDSKIKKISRSEYAKLTNCSNRTAVTDLQDLFESKNSKTDRQRQIYQICPAMILAYNFIGALKSEC